MPQNPESAMMGAPSAWGDSLVSPPGHPPPPPSPVSMGSSPSCRRVAALTGGLALSALGRGTQLRDPRPIIGTPSRVLPLVLLGWVPGRLLHLIL